MESFLSAEESLASLLAATFLAATLIPLSSEAVLFAVLRMHEDLLWTALAVATLGNTLGGMTSYLIGRFIGSRKPLMQLDRVRRYGAPVLVLAWLPLVGDALCVASGWLKLNWLSVMLFQTAGRFARYWLISIGALW